MASSNEPQPDHPLVTGLDQAFTGPGGNAPALAGWLDYLAHPEENSGPRVLEFQDGTAIESSGKPHPNVTGHVLERSVLRDLTLDRFFAHADVLSGQRIGTLTEDGEISNAQALGETFDLIEEVRVQRGRGAARPDFSADAWTKIKTMVSMALSRENWDGGAADNARARYSELVQWYDNHRLPALASMNLFLVKFAAIVIKARADINELMGTTVATLNKATENQPLEGLAFAISTLHQIADVTLNFPKTATETVLTMTGALSKVMDVVSKKPEDTGFGMDTADIHLGYYRMFESFIAAGDNVCQEAADAVKRLIKDENGLMDVRTYHKPPPAWPR